MFFLHEIHSFLLALCMCSLWLLSSSCNHVVLLLLLLLASESLHFLILTEMFRIRPRITNVYHAQRIVFAFRANVLTFSSDA